MRVQARMPQFGDDISLLVPKDLNRKGSVEIRAFRSARWLWSRGIYPGCCAVSARMHGRTRRQLNDREARGRRAAMIALAIPYQRQRRAE
jgi:hypothetical protein